MRNMILKRAIWAAAFLCASGAASDVAPDGSAVVSQPALARMAAADVILLGEIHDNAWHHQGQAHILAVLKPKAVVFEMLSPAQASLVNGAGTDDLAGLGQRIGWEAAGWPDFNLYAPIFAALGTAQVVGAAAPRGIIRAAFTDGAATVFGAEAARYGLTQDVAQPELDLRKQMQFDAHCAAMPIDMMGGMVEAQRLRDALFADAALEALETYGAPVVVIVGNGHARRDWGMPAMIARASPDVKTVAVGFVEVPSLDVDPRFDITLPTARVPRGDPCAAFRQN